MTNTLRFPAADPAAAAAFFAAELAFEADPDDVVRDLLAGTAEGFRLVETRSAEAFARLRIPGAINLPHWDADETTTADWDRDLVYVCYCESFECNAATKGALELSRHLWLTLFHGRDFRPRVGTALALSAAMLAIAAVAFYFLLWLLARSSPA